MTGGNMGELHKAIKKVIADLENLLDKQVKEVRCRRESLEQAEGLETVLRQKLNELKAEFDVIGGKQ